MKQKGKYSKIIFKFFLKKMTKNKKTKQRAKETKKKNHT